ncbi:MAG: hypothetical protein ABIF82_12435 [Planctomycetota bacterium]
MKKRTKIILIAVPVVLIVLWIVFSLMLSTIASTAVETVLPKITKTPVKLESFSLSIFSGKGSIKGFIIGNPEGFKTASSFELGKVRIDIDLMSLLSDTIVIEEIYIDAPKITYEMGMPSNIGQIQKNVEEFSGPAAEGEKPEEKAEEEAGPGKKILIKHFLLENGKVSVSAKILQGQALTVPLPTVEKHNIGGEGEGKSVAEVSKEIFTSVGSQVTEVATAAINQFKELGGKALKAGTEAGGKALEAGKEAGGKALETGKEAGKDAVDKIKGLFGGGDKD